MSLNVKTVLGLVVPEYAITGITFLAIFLLSSKQLSVLPLVLIPFVVYLLALFGFNVLNQVFDVKIDAITKPKRPIPAKIVTKQEALFLSGLLFGFSLIFAFFSKLLFPWLLFVIIILLYSHPRIFIRRYFFATPLFGPSLYLIIPYLFVSTFFGFEINYLFLAFFSISIACVSFLKDLEDMKAEKRFGIKSIPIILGANNAVKLSVVSLFLTILVFGLVLSYSNLLFVLPSVVSLLVVFGASFLSLSRTRLAKSLDYSKVLAIFMIVTVVIQLVFCLTNFLI